MARILHWDLLMEGINFKKGEKNRKQKCVDKWTLILQIMRFLKFLNESLFSIYFFIYFYIFLPIIKLNFEILMF